MFSTISCNESYHYMRRSPCSIVDEYGAHGSNDSSAFVHWREYEWEGDTALGFVVYWRYAYEPEDSNRVYDTVMWDDMIQDYNGRPRYSWEWYWADTVRGLQPHTNYVISVAKICRNFTESCLRETTVWTTLGGCLDYAKIWDLDQVHLTWGYYANPYRSVANDTIWDYCEGRWGYNDPGKGNLFFWGSDRHQVFTDTNSYDWITYDYADNTRLRQVPRGKMASLRLGNENVGGEAESITYDYYVDSTVHDLLVLQYALVMQNPGHTPSNQPHVTLELLDDNGLLMDSMCCYADFVAANDMQGVGWHTVQNGGSGYRNVKWKDWTTIGIDIAPYHGQTIKVRLTNKDCAEGGHFAYAYFTVHCDNKRIVLINKCDSTQYIHMQAPLGFEYEWTRQGDTTVLGRNYDQLVPIDTNVYLCKCSFVGKPYCYFTLSCVSINVLPVAQCSLVVDTCLHLATLINESYLEFDTTYNAYTSQCVDSILWRLDDGSIQFSDTLRLPLTQNRLYTPQLFSHLTDSYCVDSLQTPILVNFVYQPSILGDSVICIGDTARLALEIVPKADFTYAWNTGATDSSIVVVPTYADTLYSVRYADEHCADTLFRRLTIHYVNNDTLTVVNCQGFVFDSLDFRVDSTGIYTHYHTNRHACDSLYTLSLMLHPIYEYTQQVATCDTSYLGFDTTGLHTAFFQTINGCDSIVHIDLFRRTASIWGDSVACEGAPITLHSTDLTSEGGQYFWEAGGSTPSITVAAEARWSPYKLDIVVNDTCAYHLQYPVRVNPLFADTIVRNICHGYYDSLGFYETETGIYTLRLLSQHGCDSLSTLNLTHRPNYYDTLRVETCDEPYADAEWNETQSGLYTHIYTTETYGCDSILSLDLHRWEVFLDTINEEIYQGDTYTGYGFEETEEGFYETIHLDQHQCDSIYRLNLRVVSFSFPNAVTPNGDGVNERFIINDLLRADQFDRRELWIYDRTGRLIFHVLNPETEADCWSPNDTHSPDGTYFYRFVARSLSHSFDRKGVIEVLR